MSSCHHALAAERESFPLEAIDLDFNLYSPRFYWETRVRQIDVWLIYPVVVRRFKDVGKKFNRDAQRRRGRSFLTVDETLGHQP
jgi:hypothetical protein